MTIIREGNQAEFTFSVDGAPSDRLRVTAFEGVEGLSMPFRFRLQLTSEDSAVDFASIIEKPSLFTLFGRSEPRQVHGIVSRFEQAGGRGRFTDYEAEVVPSFWLLSFNARCRIFQQQTVRDIVTKVLTDGGLASDRFRFELQGSPPTREYCVQYRESDFEFVSRLLEEEGIFYFFEHARDGHTLVMADGNQAAKPLPGGARLEVRDPAGLSRMQEKIIGLRVSQEVRSGATRLRDYNYLQPTANMEGNFQADREVAHEIYDYPGVYSDPGRARDVAKVRLEALRATRARCDGKTDSRRLVPGYRLTVANHARADVNREYLLVEVAQSGTQPQSREGENVGVGEATYEATFAGVPSDVSYRPARITPVPVVRGIQTAVVVGPSGEKLYMDDKGRAKVKFFWDLTEKSDETVSCWVRVGQSYAGADHGIQFHPLVGDEVIVEFLEGNPDRPLITGAVYHANNPPPLQPADRIQNVVYTPYKHRLIFDDKATKITLNTGGEEFITLADDKDTTDLGNSIVLGTKDQHTLVLSQGSSLKGISVKTSKGHELTFKDEPSPGITITDKSGKLILAMDTDGTKIRLGNDASGEIDVECAGGKVNVKAAEIQVVAESKIGIKAGSEIKIEAPTITIDAKQELKGHGMSVSVQADMDLAIKGTNVTVNGDMQTSVKGGMAVNIQGALVKIN